MAKRFVSIWFRYLTTDWFSLRQPDFRSRPFVLRTLSHGRMIVTGANAPAQAKGISIGMALADARAILPGLQVQDDKPDLPDKLLKRLAVWCIRFTPVVSLDLPNGLLLDASGCSHLWGGDQAYLNDISKKLNERGYDVRVAIADTVGAAWAVARFGKQQPLVVKDGDHVQVIMDLPPEALRLEPDTVERLHKLGLHRISQFVKMPRNSLRRRFGSHFLLRLNQALGQEAEPLQPVQPPPAYREQLACLDPVVTAPGIARALNHLLELLCERLKQEQKGLRVATFKGYRVDGKVEQIEIGTNRPSNHVNHLFRLFELKTSTIEPALGIELFLLEAPIIEDHLPVQDKFWEGVGGLGDLRLSELIDRLAGRVGAKAIHRYVADEHYWPERSFKQAKSIHEKPTTAWRLDKLRPVQLLPKPERIEVTAPIPDYPPMLFRRKGKLHKVVKADGPERIEQEWWLQQGQHRDYYIVEDEDGHRYWLLRLGHYDDQHFQWFLHGFFA